MQPLYNMVMCPPPNGFKQLASEKQCRPLWPLLKAYLRVYLWVVLGRTNNVSNHLVSLLELWCLYVWKYYTFTIFDCATALKEIIFVLFIFISLPYSSPHLVELTERIRINGQPISKELFAKYFWEIYEKLNVAKVR